jgi:hypothetical protein
MLQGIILGLFLFLILINSAGYQSLEKSIGQQTTIKKSMRNVLIITHVKFVDNMTLAAALNLKKCLERNPDVSIS